MTNALYVSEIREEDKKKFERLNMKYADRHMATATDLEGIEIVFGNLPVSLLNDCPTLKWVQLDSAGVDSYRNLRKDIQLTNASGAYGDAISEHMLACLLSVIKNMYRYYDQQKERSWNSLGSVRSLSDLNVLSVGMGDIGFSFAQKMHMLGSDVYGIRRTVHDQPAYLKELTTMDHLDELLPMMDVVALSLPGTEETVGLFNQERLSKMKKDAVLINVGRGSAIVQKDLISVMKEGYLSAACLDVCEHEPLPKNDPLWNTERVYITPHISGRFNAESIRDHITDIFVTNMNHYLSSENLEHIVDRDLGY